MAGVKLPFLLCETENNSCSTLLRYSALLCWLVYKSGGVILAFTSRKFPAPVCWECRVCNYTQCSESLPLVLHLHWPTYNLPHSVSSSEGFLSFCGVENALSFSWVGSIIIKTQVVVLKLSFHWKLILLLVYPQYPRYFYIFCSIYSSLLLIVSPKCKSYLYFSLDSIEETFSTTSAYGLAITLIFVSLICTSVIKGFY